MVLYQLPSGKSVYISIETLLNLTHQDVQNLEASNIGQVSNDPFQKLPYSTKEFRAFQKDKDEDVDNDETPDILSDGDDDPFKDIDLNNIPDE